MRKLFLYMLLFVLIEGVISCGDNEDFSKLHELTNEEAAELARQEAEREEQKNRIPADLRLDYEVEITISANLYSGVSLPIEIDKIAELFGITEAEVLAGIAGESGAPEIKGFAIEWTTRTDNGTASTTNSPWGHWWSAEGNVTSWGTTAMVFAEFDYEEGAFFVGQYPGRLTEGQTINIIEALRYNDKRAAVVIKINAVAPGEVSATIVSTQNLSIDMTPKSSYDAEPVKFNLDEVLTGLGVASMDDVSFVGVKVDGTYSLEPVTGKGFWYDMNGFVGSWGDDASVYTNYGDFEDDEVSIGQFPGHLEEGHVIVIKYGFMANNKIALLNITVNVVGYQDPETPPAGDPENVTIGVELSKPYSDDYANVTYDVKEVMRNAFKMTTYQIHKAIGTGELKLYVGEVTEESPSYTADAPGYWLKADGTAGAWAESLVWCSLGHNETELFLSGGNHPANSEAGNTVTSTLIATCNGGSVTINLTFNVN